MSLEGFITLRFFRSKKRNIFISVLTFISVIGVLIATASLVVVNSVVRGFEMEIKEKVLENEPHLLIYPKKDEIPDKQFYSLIKKVKDDPRINIITPYVSSTVLISSFNNLTAVKLTGVDPDQATEAYGIFRKMKSGSVDYIKDPNKAYTDWYYKTQQSLIKPQIEAIQINEKITPDIKKELIDDLKKSIVINPTPTKRRPCLFIGQALGESLKLSTGETLTLITPFGDIGPSGLMPKSRKFRICGTFFTSLYEFDQRHIYMGLKDSKKFLGIDQISGIEIKIHDIYQSDQLKKDLEQKIDLNSFTVTGFSQMNKNLLSALHLERMGMLFVLGLIIIVASFNIIATLTLVVNSRKRDISILKSLGMTNGQIRKIFIFKGLGIGFLGVFLGTLIGVLLCLNLNALFPMDTQVYYIQSLPVRLDILEVAVISMVTFGVTILASVVPAARAAKVTPVYALKG